MNRNYKNIKSLIGLFTILLYIFSCNLQKPSDKVQKSITGTFWETSTPEEQGLKSALLFDMLKEIQDNELRIRSVIIIRNGYLVLESYILHQATRRVPTPWVGTRTWRNLKEFIFVNLCRSNTVLQDSQIKK